MNEKWLLLKYSDNWADEMDIDGFAVILESEWREIIQRIRNEETKYFPYRFSLGSNEEIEYDTFEAWASRIFESVLTAGEAEVMISKLGIKKYSWQSVGSYGFFPVPEIED